MPLKMSFTIMRTKKNGDQVPIRMSIWDAFKGVPVPKLKVHKVSQLCRLSLFRIDTSQCNCCGKVHKPNNEKITGSSDGKDGRPATAKSFFTAEEDAKLIEMKKANKSWKDIMAEVKRPKHELSARFKELESGDKDETQKVDGGSKFTVAEDAKLTELKNGDAQWNQIAEQMKRSKEDVQARWRDIKSNTTTTADTSGQANQAKLSKKERKAQKAKATEDDKKKTDERKSEETAKVEV